MTMRVRTLAAVLDKGRALWPDAPALIDDGGATLDYAALAGQVEDIAGRLAARGVRRGDRVALLAGNSPLAVTGLLGAARAGAVVVPLATRQPPEALAWVLRDAGADTLLVADGHGDAGAALGAAAGDVDVDLLGAGGTPLEALPTGGPPPPPEPDDLALLVYTSGSSGRPKGVPLRHGGLVHNADAVRRALLVDDDDVALVVAPLYHVNALCCALLPFLLQGATAVLQPRFDARAAIGAIARHRCAFLTGVPTMYALLLRERELLAATDLSSLRYCVCGSSTVTPRLADAIESTLGVTMLESYGLTEGGPVVASSPRWGIRRRGSTGLPLPGTQVRVVNPETGRDARGDADGGTQGELWVRAPGTTPGYWGLPALTAERIDPDGWLRTGDLVRRDADGYLSILGRLDDMFTCGGENVYPKEVEDVLLRCPGVAEAAVVPLPDELKGAVPVAFVVPEDPELDEEGVRAAYLARGAAHAHPRRVAIVDSLPHAGPGKVDRRALRQVALTRFRPDPPPTP